ncbi:MAG: hypothetical protein AAF502_02745 [Bacteroidota bacterium]
MKPFIYSLVLVLSMASIAMSCNQSPSATSETTPEYLASFYIRYLQDERQFKAEAKFRPYTAENRDFWESVDNGVLLNGKSLPMRNMGSIGTVYTRTITGNHVPSHEFEALGQTITAYHPKTTGLKVEGEASKKNGFRLSWEGQPLADDETLTILLTDRTGKTFTMNRLGPSSAANTPILNEQLQEAAIGDATIRVVLKKRKELKFENFEGVSLSEYYSETIPFSLVD